MAGISAAGYEPGEGRLHRPRPRDQRDLRGRRLRARPREPFADGRGAGLLLGRQGRPLSDHLDRGRHGRGGLGRLEGAHRLDRRSLPARRRRPLRHQPRAPRPRDRGRRRQLDPGQGEPDRDAHRDVRGGPDGPRGGLLGRHVASLRRDRGHDDRRPRRRHRMRADQDRRALALGSGRQVQPAPPDRGGAGRRRPASPASPPSAAADRRPRGRRAHRHRPARGQQQAASPTSSSIRRPRSAPDPSEISVSGEGLRPSAPKPLTNGLRSPAPLPRPGRPPEAGAAAVARGSAGTASAGSSSSSSCSSSSPPTSARPCTCSRAGASPRAPSRGSRS